MSLKQSYKKIKNKIAPHRGSNEIDPDEIFLDSSNLPEFDVHQFEGRMEKPIGRSTLITMGIVFIAFGALYAYRVWDLQVAHGAGYENLSENNILHDTPIFSERGVIYDRNGKLLAWNVANPTDPDFPLRAYSPMDGLGFVLGYVAYPKKDSSGVYYSTSYDGMGGVEKFYNGTLTGTNGTKITETDAVGHVQSENVIEPPVAGSNLTLSINADYNQKIYQIIQSLAEQKGFTGGAAAIENLKTGEIIALTSYPEYSPNLLSNPSGNNAAVTALFQNPNNPFLDRFIDGLYTPGSTVKPYMGVAALNEGIITPDKQILSTGSISIPNPYDPSQQSVFNDWRPQGWVNLEQAISVSSDVYFYEVGGGYQNQPGLGISNIEKYMRTFGFGSPVAAPFFAGPSGTIPDPAWKAVNFPGDPWRIGDTYHTAIGQYGWQVTPMQMLVGISTIADNGNYPTPTILKQSATKPPPLNTSPALQAINPADFQVVKDGMRLGVTGGIGTAFNFSDLHIAIKTGTAELGTKKLYVNSWVMGFFPYENPQYAFVFVMEKGPESNDIGATFAAVTFIDWLRGLNASSTDSLESLGVMPTSN